MKNNSHNQSREGLRLQRLRARFQAFEYGYYAKSPTPAVGQDLVSAFSCQYNLALSLAPNPQPMQQTPQCCKCWHHSHSKLLTFLPLGSFLLVDRRASRPFPIFRTLRSGLRVCQLESSSISNSGSATLSAEKHAKLNCSWNSAYQGACWSWSCFDGAVPPPWLGCTAPGQAATACITS